MENGSNEELPIHWIRIKSKSRPGEYYYFNKETGDKTWKKEEIYKDTSSKRKDFVGKDNIDISNKKIQNNTNLKHDINMVQIYHILIKHKESRRPLSARTKVIIRSKLEAKEKLLKIRKDLVQIKNDKCFEEFFDFFKKLAKQQSDCSSANKGGDLGLFKKGKMQPEFEKTSFSLEIQELSHIIETQSGFHILVRIK